MSKKYLRKNEFRIDINTAHYGKDKRPHPAYITAKYGHRYKANSITHSRFVDGNSTFDVGENPNKLSKDVRSSRVSRPFWQKDNMFSENRLKNFRFSNKSRKKIRKFNNRFK